MADYNEIYEHTWKIHHFRWDLDYPCNIKGPTVTMNGATHLMLCLSVTETRTVNVDIRGWGESQHFRVTVVSPARDITRHVHFALGDVTKISQEIFSLDEEGLAELDDLTVTVTMEALEQSQPVETAHKDRIASCRAVHEHEILELEASQFPGNTLTKVMEPKTVFCYSIRHAPALNDFVRYRLYSNHSVYPLMVHSKFSLVDWKGLFYKASKSGSFLFERDLQEWEFPNFIRSSIVDKEDFIIEEQDITHLVCNYFMSYFSSQIAHRVRDHIVPLGTTFDHQDTTLMKGSRWTDLNLLTEDGQSFPVHRGVLVMRSRFFHTMLTTDMAERNLKEVRLDGVHSEGLSPFLEFIYCGTFSKNLSVVKAVELYKVADRLMHQELCLLCLDHLMKKLDPSNVLLVLPLLQFYGTEELASAAMELVAANAERVFLSSSWAECEEVLPELCQQFIDYAKSKDKWCPDDHPENEGTSRLSKEELKLSNMYLALYLLHKRWDEDLGSAAMELVAENAEDIFPSPSWKESVEEYPELCKRFTDYARNKNKLPPSTEEGNKGLSSEP